MALPTLDATFASSADLPRKQMLAKWLVEELGETQAPSSVLVSGLDDYNGTILNSIYSYNGTFNGKSKYSKPSTNTTPEDPLTDDVIWSGSSWDIIAQNGDTMFSSNEDVTYPWLVTSWTQNSGTGSPTVTESPAPSPLSNYYNLPERYLWAKIAVAAGGPKTEADYISLPKNYAWSDIYNAVAGSSGSRIDWSENVALGHIAAAYRGDTGNPANLATYIDWPWRYKVASIIGGAAPSGPTFPSDGLLAFWKLADLTDASGNGNNLINTNNVQFVAGKIGDAAEFDNTNYLSRSMGVNFSQDFSASLWCKPADVENYGVIFCGGNNGSSSNTFAINYTGSNSIDINNGSAAFINVEANSEMWHHIVATKDATDTKVWLNGMLVEQGANQTNSSASTVYLGSIETVNKYTGFIDAVGIWNRVLSNVEIATLYNEGSGIEL